MIVKFKKLPGRFITIDREPIDDNTSISFRAKGVLTYLMGCGPNWKPNQKEIASHAKDGLASIKAGIKELQDAGYVTINRIRDNKSKKWIGWEWVVSDVVQKPKVENKLSGSEKPKVDFPSFGKTDFRKIDFVNNKELNNKNSNKKDNNNNVVVGAIFSNEQLDSIMQKYGITEPLAKLKKIAIDHHVTNIEELDKAVAVAHAKAKNPSARLSYARTLFLDGLCTENPPQQAATTFDTSVLSQIQEALK